MTSNEQRIRCLFGYHKYDEEWVNTSILNKAARYSFKVCSTCRLKGQFTPRLWDTVTNVFYDRDIIEETSEYFMVQSKSQISKMEKRKTRQTICTPTHVEFINW